MGELRSKLINSSVSQVEFPGGQQNALIPFVNHYNNPAQELGKRYLRSSDEANPQRYRHPLDSQGFPSIPFQGSQSDHAADYRYPQRHPAHQVN